MSKLTDIIPTSKQQRPRPDSMMQYSSSKSNGLLVPDLPGQFRSTRHSYSNNDERVKSRAAPFQPPSESFFIPGITGKARCLEVEKPIEDFSLSQPSTESFSYLSSLDDRTNTMVSGKSQQSRGSFDDHHPESSIASSSKSIRSKELHEELQETCNLCDSLLASIQSRREQLPSECEDRLDEQEYQRMLKELLRSGKGDEHQPQNNIKYARSERAERSLRERVDSIRVLLADHYDRHHGPHDGGLVRSTPNIIDPLRSAKLRPTKSRSSRPRASHTPGEMTKYVG